MTKNILELIMIVKNSGEIIRKTLQSVEPYISSWCILDTGSTDNTMNIIKEELKNVKGNLYQEPFTDFSTSRNRSLELSKKDCKYQIILDDSYVLHGGKNLIKLLSKSNKSSYTIKIGKIDENCTKKFLTDNYYSLRIIKTDKNFKYKGRIHEAILDENTHYLNETSDIFIVDLDSEEHLKRTSKRLKYDIELLLMEYNEQKGNNNQEICRTLYYLGTTNNLLNNFELSVKYFDELSSLKFCDIGDEYLFVSLYKSASIKFFEIDEDKNKYINSLIKIFKLFPYRHEPFYNITCMLYEEGNYNECKKNLDILINSKPPNLFFTTYDNKMYTYYIPYLYIDVNLKLKNFNVAINKLKYMLDLYPTDNLLLNIKYLICEPPDIDIFKYPVKTFVFHMGTSYNNNIISGSEIMAINLCKEFVKYGFKVFIFGEWIIKQDDTSGVTFLDSNLYFDFCTKYHIDFLIVSRFTKNLLYLDNIDNIYLWIHDVLPQTDKKLPIFSTHQTKFKGFLSLSNWHSEFIHNKLGIPKNLIITTRNAIYKERFLNHENIQKIKNRFIFFNDPARGLTETIKIIPKIKERYTDTTLYIFVRNHLIDDSDLKKIKELSSYVFLKERLSQEELSIELLKSDIWLYPCTFKETYCICALEAMASKCLVASVALAGLKDTISNRGILCKEPVTDDKNSNELLNKLFYAMDNPIVKQNYIDKAYEWAMEQTYENLCIEWLKIFKERNKK